MEKDSRKGGFERCKKLLVGRTGWLKAERNAAALQSALDGLSLSTHARTTTKMPGTALLQGGLARVKSLCAALDWTRTAFWKQA